MEIKRKAKNLRDKLQQGIYKVINPVVHGMINSGTTLLMQETTCHKIR